MSHMQNFSESEAIAMPDRRHGERYVTVLKIGRAIIGERDQLCLIRNFSSGGVKIDLPVVTHTDDRVTIELRSDRVMQGTVRWSHDHESGVELDEPVSVADMLDSRPPSSLLRRRPRAPRFRRAVTVGLVQDHGQAEGPLHDISLNGICVEAKPLCRAGQRMVVHVDGLPARSAIVKWVSADRIGLHFERPWPYSELAAWLESHDPA